MTGPKGGRPPIPTRLKLLRGSEPRGINRSEPQPATLPRPPAPPRGLGKIERSIWRKLAPVLWRAGVLSELDLLALERLVEAIAILRRVRETEGLSTLLIRDRDRAVRVNPLWRIARDADRMANSWIREFGMSPSSRSSIELGGPDAEDELERLLGPLGSPKSGGGAS